MNNFDAVDFSERHPEEVISFFWRSVYMPATFLLRGTPKVRWKMKKLHPFSKKKVDDMSENTHPFNALFLDTGA